MIQFIKEGRYWSKSLYTIVLFVEFTGIGRAFVIDEETKERHTLSITDLTPL